MKRDFAIFSEGNGGIMPEIKTMRGRIPVPCPVCDSGECRILYTPVRAVHNPHELYGAASGIQGTQTVVRCMQCGMIYENPRFSGDVIAAAYASSKESGHDSQYAMRVKSFSKALKILRNYIAPSGSAVLDIGTAGGAFLEAARNFGYCACGLEPSSYLHSAVGCGAAAAQGNGYEYVRPKAGIPYPYERSENLLSALACFDRLNTPLQAAWTYHSMDMPCAAFTPVSTHVFASTPTAECRLKGIP